MHKLGCGRLIRRGELAWDRWGIVLCPECDKETPASHLAVYYGGLINRNMNCGDRVFKLKRTKVVKGKQKSKARR